MWADFPFYAETCLKILTKTGEIVPFALNRAQRHVHKVAQQQAAKRGFVRLLLPKSRQLGMSTYIEARYYWRTTMTKGTWAYVLTHLDEATKNLFSMTERFHKFCPTPYRPKADTANANEMSFGALESGFKVSTAGSKSAGRGGTIKLLHGCLSPKTWVISETGALRNMGDMAVGDLVFTHTGKLAPISFISKQQKSVLEVRLKGNGLPVVATAEHQFLTRDGWKNLSDISVGECIGQPIAQIVDQQLVLPFKRPVAPRVQGGGCVEHCPDTVRPDYALGRIMGLYLAEGCVSVQYVDKRTPCSVTFAVHRREASRTEQWLDALPPGLFTSRGTADRKGCLTTTVTVYGRSFASFINDHLGRTDHKRLPAWWRDAGKDFVRGMAHGYLSGDAHCSTRKNDRRITAPSIRSAISVGMRDALAALGYGYACLDYTPSGIRHGRNEKAQWILRLCGEGVDKLSAELGWKMPPRQRKASTSMKVEHGYAWVPVLSKTDAGIQPVMDFEIDHPDHSYCIVQGATHNSEVAYWPHALEHAAGVMQAVPKGRDQIGTEIFLESTSAGPGNYFHTMCKEAISGINEYELVFLPWFWEDGYVLPVGPKFRLDDDEMEVQRTFNLSLEQMAWRRSKIVDLKSVDRFYQEYPSTVTEAFQGVGGSSYIPMPLVDRARKCTDADPYGPVVFGLDVARGGGTGCDDSALCIREGRYIHAIERKHGWDTMEIANWVVAKSKIWRPRRIFVDVIGLGAGVVDRLHELGMPVTGVAGSEKAIDEAHYFNRRVEMYGEFRDWLKSSPVRIPDDDRLASDIVSVKLKRYDARGREQLMLKEDIKKDTGFSPDGADACALTFAAPVPMYAQESFEPGRQGMVAGESFEPEEA